MTSEEFRAIAVLAFKAVDSPDYEAFYRKVCRWYSKNFATPLQQVEEMADQYVLRHYFEDQYGALLESGTDDAAKRWAEAKDRVIRSFQVEDEEADEEDFWEKNLEEEFKRDNPHLYNEKGEPKAPQPTAATSEPDADGWVHAPNLNKEIQIEGETEIPTD
jgi:hypothetical protein